jgi:hypothetical protein
LKRAVEEVARDETVALDLEELAAAKVRILALQRPFVWVAPVESWKRLFLADSQRYPILILMAPSASGKTEYAKSLFQNALELKIGMLENFPGRMKEFDRRQHGALVLDNLGDVGFLQQHEEKIQGKYDQMVEFAPSPTCLYSYFKLLLRVPIVVTCNLAAKRTDLLKPGVHDFLGNLGNRVIVKFRRPTYVPLGEEGRVPRFVWDESWGCWEEVL